MKLQATEGGVDSLLPLIEEYNVSKFTTVEETKLGKYAGIAQQYIFHYIRNIENA